MLLKKRIYLLLQSVYAHAVYYHVALNLPKVLSYNNRVLSEVNRISQISLGVALQI